MKTIIGKLKVLFAFLFVYITLFEFILPVNRVLPKPTLLLESLLAVWGDYNLLSELSSSTLMIYGSILLAYILIFFFRDLLIKLLIQISDVGENLNFFRYFPAIFYAVIFAYWFPDSIWAQFGFILTGVVFYLLKTVGSEILSVHEHQILVAKNLGLSRKNLYKEIYWKNIQPGLFKSLLKIHYLIWMMVLTYEFINNYFGIGHIYNQALIYKDFAGIFSLAVYVAVLILVGDIMLKYYIKKIVFWGN